MAVKDQVGRFGEDLAAQYVRDQGWEVLARNWRGSGGELDIIAVDGADAVAIEVKTRRSTTYGSPQEAVTARKMARLRRLLVQWLSSQERAFDGLRVDVIAVSMTRGRGVQLEHLRGVE